ncbi:MAG: hypothetical protein ACREJC_08745 [Tepidisphaeraceae bacterium]
MRFLGLIVSLAAVAGCASGGNKSNATVEGKVVTTWDDPKLGIRLTYPGEWEEVTFMRPKGAVLMLALPHSGGLGKTPPVVAVVAPDSNQAVTSADLDGMQQRTIEKAGKEIGEFKLVESKSMTVGGQDARRIIYTGKKLGLSIQTMYVLTTHAGRPFAFSYLSSPDTFSTNLSAVDRMIGSVQFAGASAKK